MVAAEISLFATASRLALPSPQASYPIGTGGGGGSFTGVKRPGREADHSPPPRAEIKNAWRYTSTLLMYFFGVVLS
jgi:hypothetical protein